VNRWRTCHHVVVASWASFRREELEPVSLN
jgi:hypothetical protein